MAKAWSMMLSIDWGLLSSCRMLSGVMICRGRRVSYMSWAAWWKMFPKMRLSISSAGASGSFIWAMYR